METYPVLTNEGNRSSAFEVETAYIGPAAIARLLDEVEGVTEVRRRKILRGSSEIHVEFKYLGQPCIVWEPYGDSSRYWIGPRDGAECGGDSASLEQAFKCHRVPLYRAILGDVLTLRFITRLVRSR